MAVDAPTDSIASYADHEYTCKKCDEVSEVPVTGSSESPSCRRCGSGEAIKLICASSVSAGSPSYPRQHQEVAAVSQLVRESMMQTLFCQ
jgi:hypothetical protein